MTVKQDKFSAMGVYKAKVTLMPGNHLKTAATAATPILTLEAVDPHVQQQPCFQLWLKNLSLTSLHDVQNHPCTQLHLLH